MTARFAAVGLGKEVMWDLIPLDWPAMEEKLSETQYSLIASVFSKASIMGEEDWKLEDPITFLFLGRWVMGIPLAEFWGSELTKENQRLLQLEKNAIVQRFVVLANEGMTEDPSRLSYQERQVIRYDAIYWYMSGMTTFAYFLSELIDVNEMAQEEVDEEIQKFCALYVFQSERGSKGELTSAMNNRIKVILTSILRDWKGKTPEPPKENPSRYGWPPEWYYEHQLREIEDWFEEIAKNTEFSRLKETDDRFGKKILTSETMLLSLSDMLEDFVRYYLEQGPFNDRLRENEKLRSGLARCICILLLHDNERLRRLEAEKNHPGGFYNPLSLPADDAN
ncbi:MAG TPA: hypothetical protein EYO30_04905, partial [Gemmatimonadetes bacterium]|nr:hypothetical protein [Gemmatimonadota bacterium]